MTTTRPTERACPALVVSFTALAFAPACGATKAADAKQDDSPSGLSADELESMASEAEINVKRIADGAFFYYGAERVGPDRELSHSLPPAAPTTPPKGSCCKQDKGVCPVDSKLWEAEGWMAVNFGPVRGIRYSYALEVEDDTFTVHAYGDLDCDGTFSDYALSGRVVDGSVVLDPELTISNPLE